jgi:hypothetical protein
VQLASPQFKKKYLHNAASQAFRSSLAKKNRTGAKNMFLLHDTIDHARNGKILKSF